MSFLPSDSPRPKINWQGTTLELPASSDPAWFNREGLPLATTSRFGSSFIIPWDVGICDKNPGDLIRMLAGRQIAAKDKGYVAGQIGSVPVELGSASPRPADPSLARVTWLGHATCVVEMAGKTVLTDPIFSDRCSPTQCAGPKRYTPPAASIRELVEDMGLTFDVCVISHDHFDHLDEGSVTELSRLSAVKNWYVPLGTKSVLVSYGADASSVHEMSWWEDKADASGLTVSCLPAQHWCCRRPWDRNTRLWATWAVVHGEGPGRSSFFFGGDTGYPERFPLFRQIGAKYGPFSCAAIPIGSYAPRWFHAAAHTDPVGALSIHDDIQSETSVGIHWGTFPLADEAFHVPVAELLNAIGKRAREKVKGEGKGTSEGDAKFVVLRIGESVVSGEASVTRTRSNFKELLGVARRNLDQFEDDMKDNCI